SFAVQVGLAPDETGAPLPPFSGVVTLALSSDDAALMGTTSRSAVAGVAPCDDLAVSLAPSALALVATSGDLGPATSAAFDAAGGTLARAVVTLPATTTPRAAGEGAEAPCLRAAQR